MTIQPNQPEKPRYQPPEVTTYTVNQLMQQLGPARASSDISGRSALDEELLFGEEY